MQQCCGEENCEECEYTELYGLQAVFEVMVPWIVIKEIYAKAVEHLKQETADAASDV